MHGRLAALTGALTLAMAGPAAAVPACTGAQPPQTVLDGQGSMESVIAGPDRALYYTDTDRKALMRLAAPGAQPQVVADGIDAGGGLLAGLDGHSIVVGYGDGIVPGAIGNVAGQAGLISVDTVTGTKTTVATGLGMANGLARDAAGTVYASSDVGTGIDRVAGATVQRNWATVVSPNGLAIDAAGEHLFANQTFQPAAIQRIDLADPSHVEPYLTAGAADLTAGLDGLTIDARDRLFAAANQAGEVWRVDTDRTACALARGLQRPSAVAFGAGGAFPFTDLYAVGFGGVLTRMPGVRGAPTATARPRTIRRGRRARVTVTVRADGAPLAGARVRGKTTGADGRARLTVRPRRRGTLRIAVDPDTVVKLRVR